MRRAIVQEARSWIGTPYLHQASLKGVSCDCLGLVRGVWRAVIGPEPEPVPPYRPDWAELGGEEVLLEAAGRWLRPTNNVVEGDVLLFRMAREAPAKHAAIVSSAGEGRLERMVHAYWGRAVVETAAGPWWRERLAGVFAFPVEG